ncbi:glycosyltransferase family 2 protein [Gelatiniphilus marinus]|uniref:Glycosyltransferase family 2 protein n=1 Tax=Gelatiniphilus marinus TaxID=1759464 RepID=A0ABW5JQF3_9FLAO
MLSILIPVYNCHITPLAKELYRQVLDCGINFEILVYDDASTHNVANNKTINQFKNTTFKILPENIGRSAIRNLLALNAKHEWLLFLDADTFPVNKDFIRQYLSNLNYNIVVGGIAVSKKPKKKACKLRWLFTKKRETKENSSANFIIKKSVFKTFPFDESIKKYGYEDVLFFNTLKKNKEYVHNIENQVYHNTEEGADSFLKKTETAIENLLYLQKNNKIENEWSKILQYYYKLEALKLTQFTAYLFLALKSLLVKNLNSSNPSLLLFDFYRLGYFCLIKKSP